MTAGPPSLEIIAELGSAALAGLGVDALFARAAAALGVPVVTLRLAGADGLTVRATRGGPAPGEEATARAALDARRPLVTPGAVVVPLLAGERALGTLAAHGDVDAGAVQAVANVFAFALDRRTQRMRAAGGLAHGVAHDLNNYLAVIANFGEVAATELPAASPAVGDLEQIVLAARAAGSLTREIVGFARNHEAAPEAVDVAEVLRGLDIPFEADVPEGLHRARIGRQALERVLTALLLNARDALGGTIRVRARNADGPAVVLSVEDTGTGMAPDVLARAVDPYFTTKASSGAKGFGLATAYGHVSAAGGELELDSTPGAGTVVRVRLPASSAAG